MIVSYTYSKGQFGNNISTFNPSLAAGWQLQIYISFPANKINKIVNCEMAKENSLEIPVYLPYIVNQIGHLKNWNKKY